jgi:uncharacterized membrane protein
MDMLDGEGGVRDYNLERLIMLSDGVFAIALTLLALELRPPEHWDGSAVGLLNAMILPLMAFLISFMSIGFYWTGHRRSFKRFRKADGALTALNFVLLALVTLVPVGTRMIMEHGVKGDSILLYAGLLSAIGVANAALWGYAAFIGRGIIDPGMPFGLRLVIFLILLLVPGTMGTLGVLAGSGGSPWLFALMGVLWMGVAFIRRRVGKGYED